MTDLLSCINIIFYRRCKDKQLFYTGMNLCISLSIDILMYQYKCLYLSALSAYRSLRVSVRKKISLTDESLSTIVHCWRTPTFNSCYWPSFLHMQAMYSWVPFQQNKLRYTCDAKFISHTEIVFSCLQLVFALLSIMPSADLPTRRN